MSKLSTIRAGFVGALGIASPLTTSPSPLAHVTVADLYPELDADRLAEVMPLSRGAAQSVPAVARARDIIVTAISGLPLVGMRGREVVTEADPILRPDPGRPRVITLAWTVDALFHYGRAWWVVLERHAEDGRPSAARYIHEQQLTFDQDGRPETLDGSPVREADLIRFDGLHEGLCNRSGLTIRRAQRTTAAAARAADNPVPSVELHQTGGDPLTDPQIDKLIARWAAARRGSNGGVAYTNASVEAKMHGQAAEQLLIDGLNASALDVARVCGVPAWAVDASVEGSSLTYSNVPSRSRELLDYTLRGYLDVIEGRLSADDVLPRGRWARFDVTRLLRGDFKERMEAAKLAKETGIYTDQQLRDMQLDAPLED